MKVLMCRPTHYAIRYEINPWMKLRNPIKSQTARSQWEALVRVLRRMGVEIQIIAQRKPSPDMVFTANAGIVCRKTFIPSHFRYPQRRAEEVVFAGFFKRHGYRVVDAAQGAFFEGEGDLLPYRDLLFGGYRFRSELDAHERVGAFLKKRVVGLDLIQPHFYHLDTCFCPLDERSVLYFPGAFDRYGRKAIERFVLDPIAVSLSDARQFACNALRVGRSVVLNRASRVLKGRLARRAYEVIETPTSEFIKAGGSVKCLVLKL